MIGRMWTWLRSWWERNVVAEEPRPPVVTAYQRTEAGDWYPVYEVKAEDYDREITTEAMNWMSEDDEGEPKRVGCTNPDCPYCRLHLMSAEIATPTVAVADFSDVEEPGVRGSLNYVNSLPAAEGRVVELVQPAADVEIVEDALSPTWASPRIRPPESVTIESPRFDLGDPIA